MKKLEAQKSLNVTGAFATIARKLSVRQLKIDEEPYCSEASDIKVNEAKRKLNCELYRLSIRSDVSSSFHADGEILRRGNEVETNELLTRL